MGETPLSDAAPDEHTAASHVRMVRVSVDEAGLRLDRWFKRQFPHVTHARLERWLRTGQVRVDGGRCKAGIRLNAGQMIRIPPLGDVPSVKPATSVSPVTDDDIADLVRRVLHRDDHIIAVDKPAGLPVQGGTGTRRHLDAMLDGLRFGGDRPRLVHRLDRDTSGVLILARSATVAARLAAAFRTHAITKLYWAVVAGVPAQTAGRIDFSLAKGAGHHGERIVTDPRGRGAVTSYRVLARAGRRAAWLALQPHTGRTHQLRAHCLAMGTPILGDGKYGGRAAFLEGTELAKSLHLHARAIRFPHPTGGTLTIIAPPPAHLRDALAFFGFSDEQGDIWPIE